MIVGTVKETFPGERRVALTPHVVPALKKAGCEVILERGAGDDAGFPDAAFEEKEVRIIGSRAEVFATAGTSEKRELLTRLGVRHVMNSRSLSFGDEIMELTAGEGVEIALNQREIAKLTRTSRSDLGMDIISRIAMTFCFTVSFLNIELSWGR